jgi:hypothetical protein
MTINRAKYLSYAEAWRRIKEAMDGGFYFEVVTLCESILSDRLLSYVQGVHPSSKITVKTPFAKLIKEWRALAARKLPQHGERDLGAAVDDWRIERNTVVHGLTKSAPGAPTAAVLPFLQRAEQTAKDGVSLARAVSNWHKLQLTDHKKSLSSGLGRTRTTS